MKKILFGLTTAAVVLTAAAAPRVSRTTLAAMEKSVDDAIQNLWSDNPLLLVGNTRGVYLEGYGAVFTVEVNLVANPISLMNTRLTEADKARYHQTKLERVAVLKKTLRQALASTAASLDSVPPEEKVTIVAFLYHTTWEDMTGIPVQMTVEGQKKTLVEAQRAHSYDSVRVTEN